MQGRLSHELTRPMKQGIWEPAGSAKQSFASAVAADVPVVEPLVPTQP